MDATDIDPAEATLEALRMEPAGSPPVRTCLFGATCPALESWGRDLGFPVLYLGVADDPLRAVQELSSREHGRGGLILDQVQEDVLPWRDWVLAPVAGALTRSDAAERWGGAMRVTLPAASASDLFARRLETLLSPLVAFRVATRPEAVHVRRERGVLPPPSPRYTWDGDGWVVSRGLYRCGPGDGRYVSRALEMAICSFVLGAAALDLIEEEERALGGPVWWAGP